MEKIIKKFEVKGNLLSLSPYGEGHINDTLLAVFDDGGIMRKYILQRISKVFKDPPSLMKNIELVTEFMRSEILKRGGDPERETLTVVKTTDGKAYFTDEERTFRAYLFIDNATAYQTVEKQEHFFEAAMAFGNFVNLLKDFDASLLSETLPDFHNTRVRFNNFAAAVKDDKLSRAATVQKEIAFVNQRERYADHFVRLLESGEIPLRVTHNDTKLNNVMIDNISGKAKAVIDLDTVMPGTLCYDFGDSIRFGCNTAAEDERDLSKVTFSVELFDVFVKGYLSSVGDAVTKAEKDNLVMGAIVMTYECGMRFLTDYLLGDVYFKTHREGHNLDRARTQFKMVEEMERLYGTLMAIIKKY